MALRRNAAKGLRKKSGGYMTVEAGFVMPWNGVVFMFFL